MTDKDLRDAFNRLEKHIEERYGVPVRVRDVPDPFTGDLDGAEIHVDYDEEVETALFIIAHLFGHTVQWNTSPESREIGYRLYPNPTEEQLQKLKAYEHEACQYSMTLFHEAGVSHFDQWLSDYSACDFAYLVHFYRTGEKRPFKSFWKEGAPMLKPKPIPPFRPQRWVSRTSGIVV
ncbi:MAG: hypothetical protein ACOZIN_10350 [Myxococcota bacterium]